jgi:hypothetical protein
MKKIDYTNYKKPSDFMSFSEGENRIRIVSTGVIGFQHVMKTANRFVNLGLCTEDSTCEHCAKGYEPKRVWKWIVLDYSDMRIKILDAGPMLGNQICEIASISGDPEAYDIKVTRSGQKLQTEYTALKGQEGELPEEIKNNLEFSKKRLVNKYLKSK